MVKMMVQVTTGSCDRRVYNEGTLEFIEIRSGENPYPYPYGFIVGTVAEDGDCVDCYLITKDKPASGSIVECEPVGLLEQIEGEEIDHKVLAVIPGQEVEVGEDIRKELYDFIQTIFTGHPEMHITVGQLLPREDALRHIQESLRK
jgi:inorganic pyrophosphatase